MDIVGSADLTVTLGPERMQRLLAGAFDELNAIVEERVWDPCRMQLALASVLLRRWADLEPMLRRFDELAAKGAPLLGAFAAAVREEIAAAGGGPVPTHHALRSLRYLGFSQLLSYRPPRRRP